MSVTTSEILKLLRDEGWAVAVHNDYRQQGRRRTFWLFTKPEEVPLRYADGLYVKGEGPDDEYALVEIARKLRLL